MTSPSWIVRGWETFYCLCWWRWKSVGVTAPRMPGWPLSPTAMEPITWLASLIASGGPRSCRQSGGSRWQAHLAAGTLGTLWGLWLDMYSSACVQTTSWGRWPCSSRQAGPRMRVLSAPPCWSSACWTSLLWSSLSQKTTTSRMPCCWVGDWGWVGVQGLVLSMWGVRAGQGKNSPETDVYVCGGDRCRHVSLQTQLPVLLLVASGHSWVYTSCHVPFKESYWIPFKLCKVDVIVELLFRVKNTEA